MTKGMLMSSLMRIFFIVLFVMSSFSAGFDGYAQQADVSADPQQSRVSILDPGKVKESLNELKHKIKAVETNMNADPAGPFGMPMSRMEERTACLREIEAVYQQQLTSIERQSSLKKEEENLDKKLQSRQESIISKPPPYTLSEYDMLLDQLSTGENQEKTMEIALKSIKNELEAAKSKADETGQKVREITEKIDWEKQTEKSLPLLWDLEHAQIENERAKAQLDLLRINAENTATELRLVQLQKGITERHVNWIRDKVIFDNEDLQKRLNVLAEMRTRLQARVETLRQEQKEVESAWLKAQQDFGAARNAEEIVSLRADELLKAREAWRETYQKVLEQTESMIFFVNQEEQVWKHRYALLKKDVGYEELEKWRQETQKQIDAIDRDVTLKENYQQNLQTEIAAIQKKLAEEDIDPDIRQHRESHVAALNKMAERNFEYLTLLQRLKDIEQRLQSEFSEKQKPISFMNRIGVVGERLNGIWGYELWVIDERSVTVKKVVVVLFILITGMMLARWFTSNLFRHILSRTGLDENVAAALEKMIYFLALLILIVFALHSVNIPLAVFTFLGGAVAIAVGFGAQKLLNNFISGFILLAERPVKINDMIEVENNFGIIEKIGMRCTRVRTPGNIHILVPNSSFLEKNIVNWTLSDQEIRASVSIGVAYNSDPRQVSEILCRAVQEHQKILTDPPPVVLFDAVEDSLLKFVVYFWINMEMSVLLERRIIESDVRHRIIELFRKAGIVVAFPQRDVHLDTSKPLEFRYVGSQEGAVEAWGGSVEERYPHLTPKAVEGKRTRSRR